MSNDVLSKLQSFLKKHPIGKDVVGRDICHCPPCNEQALKNAELKLGFQLPLLLKDIYSSVANGGFGPGYGVIGVSGGFTDDEQQNIEDIYKTYAITIPDEPTWKWPDGWIPFCHWGCIIYSVIDCFQIPNPIYFICIGDKEPDAPMKSIIHFHKPSLAQWLTDWMDGKNLWDEVFGN